MTESNFQDQERRQYVWLIRYGRTDPPLLENIGNFNSDLHFPDGINHATAIGRRLAADCGRGGNGPHSIPKFVYSDPFLRCMRTADVATKILNESSISNVNEVKIRVEEGTTEWQVSSLLVDQDGQRTHPKSTEDLAKIFPDTVDASYRSVNPQGPDRGQNDDDKCRDDSNANGCPPRFPEDEEQLHARCQTTIQKILNDVGNVDSFAIVGHAPCVQSTALALEGSASPEDCSIFGPWSLGGMTLFSRPVGDEEDDAASWTLEFYSDTTHMPGEYRDGKLGQWSLPSFAR